MLSLLEKSGSGKANLKLVIFESYKMQNTNKFRFAQKKYSAFGKYFAKLVLKL